MIALLDAAGLEKAALIGHSMGGFLTLRALVERHAAETGSARATEILQDWPRTRAAFLQVCPVEMLAHLKHPLAETGDLAAVPAE